MELNVLVTIGDNKLELETFAPGLYTVWVYKKSWTTYAFPGYREVPQDITRGPYLIKAEAEAAMRHYKKKLGAEGEHEILPFKYEVALGADGKKEVLDPDRQPLVVEL